MDTKLKVGFYLNGDKTVTKVKSKDSIAVVFDVVNRLAVLPLDYQYNFKDLQSVICGLGNEDYAAEIPTQGHLRLMHEHYDELSKALLRLGTAFPKKHCWTADKHDEGSYYTQRIQSGYVNHAGEEEQCPAVLVIAF